jgi:hypothetical protein
VTVVVVDAFYCYRIITTETFDSPGTDEVFPTSGSIHDVNGSRGGPCDSGEINQPPIRREHQVVETGDDLTHVVFLTIFGSVPAAWDAPL